MNGSPISFAPYVRKLKISFAYGSRKLEERRGFLLRKKSVRGFCYSEAAPLPGHSQETLDQVEKALRKHTGAPPPSLRFALECLEMENGPHFPVRSNALLQWRSYPEASADLKLFREQGYTHCKIKIAASILEEIGELIEANPNFLFRLDANQSLTPNELQRFLRIIEKRRIASKIDYLEEPFAEIWHSKAFANTPIKYAADESAHSLQASTELLDSLNPPGVFIVKPAVQGGLEDLSILLDRIRMRSARAVVTSTLETEVGRRAILSFVSQRKHEVAGLSTGFLFQEKYLDDCPSWPALPTISFEEQAWLDSLSWEESAW